MQADELSKGQDTLSLQEAFAALSRVPVLEAQIAALESQYAGLVAMIEGKDESLIPKGRKWVTLKEAAAILACHKDTVRNYVTRGLLRKSDASRHILIPAEDIEEFAGKVTLRKKAK